MALPRYSSPARPAARRVRAAAAAALAGLPLLAGPVGAAEPSYRPGLGAQVELGASAESRPVQLSIGRSIILDLPRDAKEVFVANPAVANAVVRSARKIFLIGIANGATSMFVMDAEGRQIAALEVNVGRDLAVLRQTLRTALPSARIEVRPAGDSIVLTGQVVAPGDAQQAVDIARAFVGQTGVGGTAAAAGAGSSSPAALVSGGVINAITIGGRDQVMLKVQVVEMARSAVKQLGVNIGGNWNVLDAATTAAAAAARVNPASGLIGFASGVVGETLGSGGVDVGGQFGTRSYNIGGKLSALERAGLSRTLAEPTLVAVSGETANFLAGGELPYPIANCTGATTGCTTTIAFKEYGVSLGFTPIVMSEGRISLRVSTAISDIDKDNAVSLYGTSIPGLRTRRSTTTVELPSGGTMATAGLISSQSAQTINGVPGLVNIPVLGALFRSRDFQRRDTELMITVTPFIAKPMEAAQVQRPDDNFQVANDPQTVLYGRLNKIYGAARSRPAGPAPAGFGFITD